MQDFNIEKIEMRTGSWGKIRAFATITFNHGMSIESFKVIEGAKGLFVGMPSVQRKNKESGEMEWKDIIRFKDAEGQPSKEAYTNFTQILIDYYKKQNNNPSNGSQESYQDQNRTNSSEDDAPWWA